MYVTAFSQTYFFFVEFNLGALSGSIGFRSVHEIQIVNFHQLKLPNSSTFLMNTVSYMLHKVVLTATKINSF